MGFDFEDSNGKSYRLNVWQWGAIHSALCEARALDPDKLSQIGMNMAASIDAGQTACILHFLEVELLPQLSGSVTLRARGEIGSPPAPVSWDNMVEAARAASSYDSGPFAAQLEHVEGLIAFLRAATPPVTIY